MPNEKPSILLICPDEMKASALGCYGQTQPVSPFIDELASESVLFEQCHTVHTKCVPSRVALLTGQYPHIGGHRTLELHARREEVNLIRLLREDGYRTVLLGKNHVVDEETMLDTFDERVPPRGPRDKEASGESDWPTGSYFVGRDSNRLEDYCDYRTTTEAVDWLSRNALLEEPFFMWLNLDAPHPPYGIPDPYYGKLSRKAIEPPPLDPARDKPPYQDRLRDVYGLDSMSEEQWKELIATYLEMCTFVDVQVRRVVEALDAAGKRRNTIILLWSDHGDFAGEHQLSEKWDTSFYDCITRVPLIMSDPGRKEPARLSALVESIDILPTLLDRVGIPIPAGVQGRNLLPLMNGEASQVRDLVFCQGGQEAELLERSTPPPDKSRPCRAYHLKQEALYGMPEINLRAKMIRDQRYKYCFRLGGPEELYDLEQDPGEIANLASSADHAALLSEYRMKMMEKLVETETPLPYQGFLDA